METLVHIGLLNAVLATGLALVAGASRLLRRRPAIVHALWLLVLLKLLTPPFLAIPIGWLPRSESMPPMQERMIESARVTPGNEEPSASPGASVNADPTQPQPGERMDDSALTFSAPMSPQIEMTNSANIAVMDVATPCPTATSQSVSWELVVTAIWLSGSVLWWTIAAIRLCRFRLLLRSASLAPAALQHRAELLAKRLGLFRSPRVYLIPAPVTPLLWAVAGAPCLLLPSVLWARLTNDQQDTLLAHELAHLRRGDPWMRRLEIVVLGLYWWHPVAWWARHEIQEAEEQCCDAWVLWALPAAAEAYAAALLETVAYLSRLRPSVPLGASGAGQTFLLRRRLTMILQGTTPRALSWTAMIVLLGCAALCLPLRPVWGQLGPANSGSQVRDVVAQAFPATTAAPQTAGNKPLNELPDGSLTSDLALTGRLGHPHGVEEVKDTIELLQVQLEGKKAELLEARALTEQAHRQLARQNKLRERGTISEEEADQSRTELTVREARLQVKQAQIKEVEVRLGQAKRLLSRMQSGSAPSGGTKSSSLSGQPLKPGTSSATTLTAPPKGVTTKAPVNVAQPKGVTPSASGTTVAPANSTPRDTSAAITGRSSIRTAGGTGGKKIEGADASDTEQRIRNLEQKLDRLIDQMESLRREIRRQRSSRSEGADNAPADPTIKPSDPARR
jgi:beta-lactamase regulating signal transducer with metallopeptidase domain